MTTPKPPTKRCAIYTRKSSEEGLDQDFNSLDAQREACAAYIASQRAEGWKALPAAYNDGGFSGGSMERPALQRLLADIAGGMIDIIVVYKIDRLTRSLADFARMVELFDRHQVSFVSVTQAFNTTTSMGRLTLNVLLSFAQFEREVTGERIRDKIAASKAKGMWMGGTPPLGYDVPVGGTRALTINTAEADIVQRIFALYLELGSVHALAQRLRDEGIRSKHYVTAKGQSKGGLPFSRGALFHLLRNRLYLGEITHRDKTNPGLHPAIVDGETFAAVQAQLDGQTRRQANKSGAKTHSPLAGRIFDADDQPMSPTFAYGKGGRLYRYYVSVPLQRGGKPTPGDTMPRRVSAPTLESHLSSTIDRLIPTPAGKPPSAPLAQISRVEILQGHVVILLPAKLRTVMASRLTLDETLTPDAADPSQLRLTLPFLISTQRGRTELIAGDKSGSAPNPALIRALRHAHTLLERDSTGAPSIMAAPASTYQRGLICLAFLAPDIQKAILAGHQPARLTLNDLLDQNLPPLWADQRQALGFPAKH
jgi:DNA invertase Pin-like site-specific DNA recombinase